LPHYQGANNTWWRRDAVKEVDMYQNRFKKLAMAKEFRGITKLLEKLGRNIDEFDSIIVKRLDENFLNSFPSCYSWDGSAGESYENTRLFGVADYKGVECGIKEIKISCKGVAGSNYAYSSRYEYEGETYLESLSKTDVDDFSYFIRYFRRYSDWSGQESEDIREITILKPPKRKKISEIIKEAEKKAMEEVRQETNF